MGLFDKFRNKNKEPKNKRNEIDNKGLKETLANTALSTFKQDKDYNNLAYTKVEFGYLFNIDGHGIEALFKIITDKETFYFAVQKTSVIRLDFNEEQFNAYTEKFLKMHG